MLKKFLIMLKKCTYNSQHTAHYAQVEPIIILIQSDIIYEMGENYLLNESYSTETESLTLSCAQVQR